MVQPDLLHAALLGLVGFVLFAIGGITVLATNRPLAVVGRALQSVVEPLPFRHAKTTGLDDRLLKQRDDKSAPRWVTTGCMRSCSSPGDWGSTTLPTGSTLVHGYQTQSLAGPPGLRRHRSGRVGAHHPWRPGDSGSESQRDAGSRWRGSGYGICDNLGIQTRLILAPPRRRSSRVSLIPVALRHATISGGGRQAIGPMTAGA